jgi:hypothetical protein
MRRRGDAPTAPAEIFETRGRANRASGFPSGAPIPPGVHTDWSVNVERDIGAIDGAGGGRDTFIALNDTFNAPNLDNNVLDIIIDMQVGFRTGDSFTREHLVGVPLGYLSAKLRRRTIERGLAPVIDSLVLVGRFYRVVSTPERGDLVHNLHEGPSPDTGRHPEYYYEKRLRRDLQEFNFMQYPFGRVEFNTQAWEENYEEALAYFQDDVDNDLSTYVDSLTREEGGSDVQFFIFGQGAYIAKRYGTFAQFPVRIREAHIMRTAGLRQVILKKYEMFFVYHDTYFDKNVLQYRLYIPGSESNCFLQSIQWFLMRHEEDKYFKDINILEIGQPEDEEGSSLNMSFDEEKAIKFIDNILGSVVGTLAAEKKKSIKEYLRAYSQGFPTSEMKKIANILFNQFWIYVSLWKKSGKGEWVNLLKRDVGDSPIHVEVTLFLMDDTGKILNIKESNDLATEKSKMEGVVDGTLGHMLHCISTYPPPPFFLPSTRITGQAGKSRSIFCRQITSVASPLLEDLYKKNRYNPEICFDELKEYVSFQNARYRRREVSTLIFQQPSTNPSSATAGDRKRKRLQQINEEREGAPRIYVYAYDLETVDNTGDIQHMVYPPFRKEVPSEYRNLYEPIQCQIPFSAQWVGVNLDDEGKFLQRKLDEDIYPLCYSHQSILRSNDLEDKKYFITDPTTNYGENRLLGECIESFLVDIAVDTHSKGGSVACLFATNGSKFDAYVVLQFQRFEISEMLKTSRGILFAKIRVPLEKPSIDDVTYSYKNDPEDAIKVSIILRDVSLIVPGSLSRLCKGFEVPKKYCKQDFPIQMVTASNCFHPEVMAVCKDYGESDVCALAVILKKINLLIGNSVWNPANHTSDKPPIVQFLTCMSMIRSSTKLHFDKVLPPYLHPRTVDIPALRNWISMAAIGGRVTAYARTYASNYLDGILKSYLNNDTESLKKLHTLMMKTGKCAQVLDFTSLYPFVMDSCPLPMGHMKEIGPEECRQHIEGMYCLHCSIGSKLCQQHRYYFGKNDSNLRPFSIIIVKNVTPVKNLLDKKGFPNFCPRKSYSTTTGKPVGLVYSWETNDEFFARKKGKEKFLETQAYSNVDLFWMKQQGFTFEIVGGMTWDVTMAYNSFIGPAFQLRIDAKKQGNKLLSDFMKLNYNGAYGITIQQDITDSFFLCNLEEEYRHQSPLAPGMREQILKSMPSERHGNDLLASEELTGEAFFFPSGQTYIQKRKKENLAEFYAKQSPMQVGAAILAYSRHVANLVMFSLNPYSYFYTDTDSIAISEYAISGRDNPIQDLIQNRDDAPMGTLKNDHADNNGTEPRIIFGMIGASKVKGYITLNAEGQLRVFNTFKGLNVSLDIGGKKISPEYAEYVTAKALLSINMNYTSEDVEVQAWKRDLSTGISIGNHLQQFEKETYSGFFKGVIPKLEDECGLIEYIVPHGKLALEQLEREKQQFVLAGTSCVPRLYDPGLVSKFLDVFYKGCEQEYHPGTEEYQKILDLFSKLVQQ